MYIYNIFPSCNRLFPLCKWNYHHHHIFAANEILGIILIPPLSFPNKHGNFFMYYYHLDSCQFCLIFQPPT